VEEVINIKVNVEAQAKRSAYPGTPGIHRQTAFRLSVFRLLSPVSCLLSSALPAHPAYLAPLTKESQCYCAKQTQFPKNQNHYNLLYCKDLSEYSAPHRPKKQTQTNPISPPHAIRHPTSTILP
jgi:hypothetical protein